MVGILTTGVSTGFSPASAEDANELLHLFSFHCQYFHFSCSLWNYVCRHGHPRHHDFTITVNIITIIIVVVVFTGVSLISLSLSSTLWHDIISLPRENDSNDDSLIFYQIFSLLIKLSFFICYDGWWMMLVRNNKLMQPSPLLLSTNQRKYSIPCPADKEVKGCHRRCHRPS